MLCFLFILFVTGWSQEAGNIYCPVPARQGLSKTGLMLARILKVLSSLSVCIHLAHT